MADPELVEDFEKAAAYLRGIAGKLDSSDLLYLYARFKQANEGPCNAPKPGFFDFQGKQKWAAWKSLEDLSREQAMQVQSFMMSCCINELTCLDIFTFLVGCLKKCTSLFKQFNILIATNINKLRFIFVFLKLKF